MGESGKAEARNSARGSTRLDRIRNPEFLMPVLLQLQILLQRPIPLERRQVVDEQLAVEMIDLVLDAGRQQVVDLEHERLAVAVQRLDLCDVLAGHVGTSPGD